MQSSHFISGETAEHFSSVQYATITFNRSPQTVQYSENKPPTVNVLQCLLEIIQVSSVLNFTEINETFIGFHIEYKTAGEHQIRNTKSFSVSVNIKSIKTDSQHDCCCFYQIWIFFSQTENKELQQVSGGTFLGLIQFELRLCFNSTLNKTLLLFS